MADKVCPGDLLKTTELVGFALKTRHVSRATGRMQVIICERLITPLVVDLELRSGLAAVIAHASDGIETMHTVNNTRPSADSPEERAMTWLRKLLGAEPL